jgi:hypothetical protein
MARRLGSTSIGLAVVDGSIDPSFVLLSLSNQFFLCKKSCLLMKKLLPFDLADFF